MTRAEVREKFANKDYPIHVIGRHINISDPMKNYAVDKLARVEKFGGRVLEATIVMDIQKLVHSVDFIIYVNNNKIKVTGRSDNMYASIDQAIERLEAKLRRYTEKLHEHHAKSLGEIDMNVNIIERVTPLEEINDQIEEENLQHVEKQFAPHKVVSRETRILKTLNQDEAIMKLELSEDQFLIYRSEETKKLRVIYQRNDGNYGIIEAEQ